jgi:hypothetical protein
MALPLWEYILNTTELKDSTLRMLALGKSAINELVSPSLTIRENLPTPLEISMEQNFECSTHSLCSLHRKNLQL